MSDRLGIIFDLDGTLIDSVPDIRAAVNRMLAAEGLEQMDRAEVQSYVGNGLPRLVERVMLSRGMDLARHGELLASVGADYAAHSADLTRLYPGVIAALEALAGAGHALGICTNKPAVATEAVLRELGLAGFFAAIVAGDTLAAKKPAPEPLWLARERLGVRSAIYVGDSEVDAECAQAAALPFALFTAGYLRVPRSEITADAEFASFSELLAIVDGLRS